MPFLVPTLDNADPLCALVITVYIDLHHIEVADRNEEKYKVIKKP